MRGGGVRDRRSYGEEEESGSDGVEKAMSAVKTDSEHLRTSSANQTQPLNPDNQSQLRVTITENYTLLTK